MMVSDPPFSLDAPAELPITWLRALWDEDRQRKRHRGARREASQWVVSERQKEAKFGEMVRNLFETLHALISL